MSDFSRGAASTLVLVLCAILSASTGCRAEPERRVPPLRPLLHTEPPAATDRPILGYETWIDPGRDPIAFPSTHETHLPAPRPPSAASDPQIAETAEDAMRLTFEALLSGSGTDIDRVFFGVAQYAESARVGRETAHGQLLRLRDEIEEVRQRFAPGPASLARPDGLVGLLRAGQATLGRPRDVHGRVVRDEDQAVMRWHNELSVRLVGTDVTFSLYFPKLLRGTDGAWRLAAAPEVGRQFRTFRALGLDLKPELLEPEHAPYPLTVGNYWQYRTGRAGDADAVFAGRGYREEVVEVEELSGYRRVRLRRQIGGPDRRTEHDTLLVTPLRIYSCPLECRRHADDLSWVLAYAERATPLLVFPLESGASWGRGGRDARRTVLRVRQEAVEIETPAGLFPNALEIVESTRQGQEVRAFVRGVGFVRVRVEDSTGATVSTLTEYRVTP